MDIGILCIDFFDRRVNTGFTRCYFVTSNDRDIIPLYYDYILRHEVTPRAAHPEMLPCYYYNKVVTIGKFNKHIKSTIEYII